MKKTKWTKVNKNSEMILDQYKIGDIVVLLVDLNGIPEGTEGKIVKGSTSEYYAVQFEGTNFPRGVYPFQLETIYNGNKE